MTVKYVLHKFVLFILIYVYEILYMYVIVSMFVVLYNGITENIYSGIFYACKSK